MHRFFAEPPVLGLDSFRLDAAESRHASRVLRLRPGDPVEVLDGAGARVEGRVIEAGPGGLRIQTVRRHLVSPPARPITLVQSMPKGPAMETIIEKALELGAARIVPVMSSRCEVRIESGAAATRARRWRATAIAALKQCGAPWLPQIDPPQPLAAYLERPWPAELALLGTLEPDGQPARHWIDAFRRARGRAPASALIWIGPEGDFTPGEIQAIRQTGACPLTLGPHVLRADTAAIAALAILQSELA
ncbi:MAG: 16S rRNA (uracil(1498)-N(3))-methyltransferase [Verrucomicrobia bacterium]|nr:16S rRNA (uracil(1498)-N(3))-methyltransferase [Verrucomicrobiota bacterium]